MNDRRTETKRRKCKNEEKESVTSERDEQRKCEVLAKTENDG